MVLTKPLPPSVTFFARVSWHKLYFFHILSLWRFSPTPPFSYCSFWEFMSGRSRRDPSVYYLDYGLLHTHGAKVHKVSSAMELEDLQISERQLRSEISSNLKLHSPWMRCRRESKLLWKTGESSDKCMQDWRWNWRRNTTLNTETSRKTSWMPSKSTSRVLGASAKL